MPSGEVAAAEGSYIVGASLELTGPLSELGEGFLHGLEAYIDRVNDDGGVDGHQVQLVALDHAGKPDQGVANVTRLVTGDGALAVTGFVLSNVCNAVERITTENEVPLLCSGIEPDMLEPARPYVYGAKMPAVYQAPALVDFAETLVESDDVKVAWLGLSAASSSAVGHRTVAAAEDKGWEVVSHDEVPPEVTDMSAQVAKLASTEPDLIFTGLQDAAFVLFMRTLQSQGVTDVPVLNYESGSSITALEGAGSDNVYVPRAFAYPDLAEGSPGVEGYVEDVTAAGGDPNGPYVINGYLAGMIVVAGLQGCEDPCTRATLKASFDQLELDTEGVTAGLITYTPDDHAPGSSVNVYRWNASTKQPELVAEGLEGSAS